MIPGGRHAWLVARLPGLRRADFPGPPLVFVGRAQDPVARTLVSRVRDLDRHREGKRIAHREPTIDIVRRFELQEGTVTILLAVHAPTPRPCNDDRAGTP